MPWRSSSQLCLDGLRLVLSRALDKACCFILKTTGLRGYLSLVTTACCLERLLSWVLGSLASGLGGGSMTDGHSKEGDCVTRCVHDAFFFPCRKE